VIPGNDDAIRSCGLITNVIAEGVKQGGQEKIKKENSSEEKGARKLEKEKKEEDIEDAPEENVWV
jgi:ribosomal protein S2